MAGGARATWCYRWPRSRSTTPWGGARAHRAARIAIEGPAGRRYRCDFWPCSLTLSMRISCWNPSQPSAGDRPSRWDSSFRSGSPSSPSRRSPSWSTPARRGRSDTTRCHYILFVTFFPHLIAGPILHHGEMMPQFTALPRRLRAERRAWGSVFASACSRKSLSPTSSLFVPIGVRGRRAVPVASSRPGSALRLHAAALFRLLRLLGHGDRPGAAVRHPPAAQLQLAVQGHAASSSSGAAGT